MKTLLATSDYGEVISVESVTVTVLFDEAQNREGRVERGLALFLRIAVPIK